MKLLRIVSFEEFRGLLIPYYREGEDADTPIEQLEGFIRYLFGLLETGTISAGVYREKEPVGFVLWAVDSPEFPFSCKPGYGTILEIGILPQFRGKGYGRALAACAESHMGSGPKYVCAYGPAKGFWEKCGYRESGETAENGLKIFVKG